MIARTLAATVLMVGVLAVGLYLGGHPDMLPDPLRKVFVDDGEAQRFRSALGTVHDMYYRDVPEKALTDNAIAGMVEKLDDPYSQYFNAKQYKSFLTQQAQEFSGIGVAVAADKAGLVVLQVYAGSPAKEAGLRPGDRIVAAGGRSLRGVPRDQAVTRVKGPEGTSVKLGVVSRGRRQRTVKVVRREIIVPQVDSRVRRYGSKRFLQLAVSGFTQQDVDQQVRRQIEKGKRAKVSGIVLDLRRNPGGLVTQARAVASIFLKAGQRIVSTKGRAVPERVLDATGDPAAPKIPVVVLVDRYSASAAEIVAGALQDHKRAKLVGTRTYGKGVFQTVIDMPGGGALDITTGQYFTPNGTNLGGRGTKSGTGLKPDVEASDDPKTRAKDEALQAAMKTLAGGR